MAEIRLRTVSRFWVDANVVVDKHATIPAWVANYRYCEGCADKITQSHRKCKAALLKDGRLVFLHMGCYENALQRAKGDSNE